MVPMKQNQSPKLHRQHHHLTLTILVAILLLACEQVLCQNDRTLNTVEMRAANDKEIGGPPTVRNIYSPRLTSPNQFMHFGKRPSEPLATKLMPSPRVFDLYRREQLPQPLDSSAFPFLFSIELERGQTLSALPEGYDGDYKFVIPHGNNLLYNPATYQHRKSQQPLQQLQQFQQYHELPTAYEQRARMSQRAYIGAKSSRLTNANYADSNGNIDNNNNDDYNNNDNNNDNSHLSDEQVNQIGYQSQSDDINLATRSLNQNRLVNSYAVPTKGFVSAVLFGRQNSPNFALGPYMKKAEPKENMFMHFGRK